MDAEPASRLVRIEPAALEVGVQTRGQVLCHASRAPVVRQPSERERGVVARRDDVGGVAQSPDLDERRILPRVRSCRPHASMEGMQGRSRNAVLKPGPGRSSERGGSRWEALVERTGAPPERDDLLARDVERWPRDRCGAT
jgi:hypothetical protein